MVLINLYPARGLMAAGGFVRNYWLSLSVVLTGGFSVPLTESATRSGCCCMIFRVNPTSDMPDLTAIATALTSLKTATDIARFLRESDLSLERAELKLKLADLIGALADTKIELVGVQETLTEKDMRIAELEQAFLQKDQLVRQNDAYYAKGSDGKALGVAYCLRCWESDHRQRQLVSKDFQTKVCTGCGHQYEAGNAYEIFPPAAQQ